MLDQLTTDAATALERAALFGQFESTGWRQRRDGSRFWGCPSFPRCQGTRSA